jgi:hypothetical protein
MSDDPTDGDDPISEADRLEQALERIAALAARRGDAAPAAAAAPANAPANAPGNTEVAARLDQLIAQLRATLSHSGA